MSLINVILLNVGQENAILLFVALLFGILIVVAFFNRPGWDENQGIYLVYFHLSAITLPLSYSNFPNAVNCCFAESHFASHCSYSSLCHSA
jgi:hypothetical protein